MVPPTVTRGDLFVRGEISSEDRLALARVGLETLDQIDTALVSGELRELVRERGTGIGAGLYRHVLYARTRTRMPAPRRPGRPSMEVRLFSALVSDDQAWLVRESLHIGCTRAELTRRALCQLAARCQVAPDPAWGSQVVEMRAGATPCVGFEARLPGWLAHKVQQVTTAIGAAVPSDVVRLAIHEARIHTELRHTLRHRPQHIEVLVLTELQQPLGAA